MPRKPRIEYAGAVYHVMCRGNRREAIFRDDRDREAFIDLMGQGCERTGWIVHSYVLMPNHYHWLLETPEPNLSDGMRWFHGTYARRFCVRHGLVGHVFQGRFKSIPIDPDDPDQFRVVSDYIHLNPARAGLLVRGAGAVRLREYPWSSFPAFLRPRRQRPEWLEFSRVAGNFGYAEDSAPVRRRYAAYLERRAADCAGDRHPGEEEEEWARIRQGWYLGSKSFRDFLLDQIPPLLESAEAGSFGGRIIREHHEHRALALIAAALPILGLVSPEQLAALPKSDLRKQAIVWLVKTNTTMPSHWVAETLGAGSRTMIHQACRRFQSPTTRAEKTLKRKLEDFAT